MTYDSEDKVERIIEATMDILDRRYLAGKITSEEYDEAVRELEQIVPATQ